MYRSSARRPWHPILDRSGMLPKVVSWPWSSIPKQLE